MSAPQHVLLVAFPQDPSLSLDNPGASFAYDPETNRIDLAPGWGITVVGPFDDPVDAELYRMQHLSDRPAIATVFPLTPPSPPAPEATDG